MGVIGDFHTHTVHPGHLELVSGDDPELAPLVSLELHPWRGFTALPAGFTEKLPQFAALGEVGFDRYRGAPLPEQLKLLDELLQLAQRHAKPVVLHAVGSCELLFEAVKPYQLNLMFHGFARHSVPLLRRLWQNGFWISLHRQLVEDPGIMGFVHAVQGERLGLESDDSPVDMATLWQQGEAAAQLPTWGDRAADELRRFLGKN